MNSKHAVTISLATGLAAIAGTIAATKSVHLGHAASTPTTGSSSLIAQRTAQLDRAEIALRKALAQKPPKLPPLPTTLPAVPAAAGSPISATATAAPAQRVVYVRPAPIIRHVHRAGGGEHESEGGHDGGHDGGGGGGGFDD